MRIKRYIEYVTELHKVVDASTSGKTKYINWIHDEPSSAKSASAGLLLKKELGEKEFDDLKASMSGNAPDWAVRDLQKKPQSPRAKRLEKFKVTLNNLQFLKDKAKESDLYCEYCKTGPLVIYDINPGQITQSMIDNPRFRFNKTFNPKDGATCDHKDPMYRGGSKFDYKNLAVCCARCNKRKGNMSWENWSRIIPTLTKSF